tara:strand:- start:3359 stop:3625 length:267 start_codon:yes stop_codon:yes gene_type:complete
MNLPSTKNSAFAPSNNSLEDVLLELERYGEPRVSKLKNGWYSSVEVFVTGKGISFDVKSDYNLATPHGAASQCYDRLMLAIKSIKETK